MAEEWTPPTRDNSGRLSVRDWDRLFRSADRARAALLKAQEADDGARVTRAEAQLAAAEANIKNVLMQRLGITEGDPDSLLE